MTDSSSGVHADSPIIIIGAPRSGTNMLKDTLAAFDGLVTWPCEEINFIWRYGNRSHPDDELRPEMAGDSTKGYVRGAFDELLRKTNGRRVVEKSCANSLRVDFVNEIFPEARFVHIVRDGLDVSASALLRRKAKFDLPFLLSKARYVPRADLPHYLLKYARNYVKRALSTEGASRTWGPEVSADFRSGMADDTLSVSAQQWKRCVRLSTEALDALPSDRYIRVRYESLVSEPAATFRSILEFLGEPVPDDLDTRVQAIATSSIGKGRNSLSTSERSLLNPIVTPELAMLGYEHD